MKRLGSVIFVLILVCSGSSQATTVRRLTLDDLVAKADSIVVGRVIDARTFWTEDHKLILTSHTVEIQQCLKGGSGDAVVVTTIGGRIGGSALRVAGMPTLEIGESAVFFLEHSGSYTTIVGLKQGKFPIADGQVQNMIGGVSPAETLAGKPVSMPLDEFKHQIQIRIGN
jgi:hypothetical protein